MKHKQKLFQSFPLDSAVTIAGEELTSPYHVYNGTMLCIGGTVDGNRAAELLGRENLTPILNENGRAFAAIWVCDFFDANLGAHHELQISLFANAQSTRPLPVHPFAYFRALTTRSDLLMVCHGLWNDTQRVVHYNAEHLCLDAKLTRSAVKLVGNQWEFQFLDTEGDMIAKGSVSAMHRQPARPAWQIAHQMGLRGFLRFIRNPIVNIPVVNTRRRGEEFNHSCQTYTACQRPFIRKAGAEDTISIEHPVYSRLAFKADFVQQLNEVGFIFLRPVRL